LRKKPFEAIRSPERAWFIEYDKHKTYVLSTRNNASISPSPLPGREKTQNSDTPKADSGGKTRLSRNAARK
jgi:hypothetical protein